MHILFFKKTFSSHLIIAYMPAGLSFLGFPAQSLSWFLSAASKWSVQAYLLMMYSVVFLPSCIPFWVCLPFSNPVSELASENVRNFCFCTRQWRITLHGCPLRYCGPLLCARTVVWWHAIILKHIYLLCISGMKSSIISTTIAESVGLFSLGMYLYLRSLFCASTPLFVSTAAW